VPGEVAGKGRKRRRAPAGEANRRGDSAEERDQLEVVSHNRIEEPADKQGGNDRDYGDAISGPASGFS
jgi:hypothetical protein